MKVRVRVRVRDRVRLTVRGALQEVDAAGASVREAAEGAALILRCEHLDAVLDQLRRLRCEYHLRREQGGAGFEA